MKFGKTITVRPRIIDDVLINPGMGFMTFQRYNGDKLNEGKGWTEGFPIENQDFSGSLENKDHPMTSIAYFRIYWRFLEPNEGEYRWDLIDHALETARSRKQTLMIRVAPYGLNAEEEDVPDWYRQYVGSGTEFTKKLPDPRWRVDPDDPRYIKHFGGFIRALGNRYNGHPDLESVDVSIVSAWGEGEYSHLMKPSTREGMVDAYVDSFTETPLIMLLTDQYTNGYGISKANVGFRGDCLGDMKPDASHMLDCYPQQIILFGMQDAWKKAPVSFEVCWVVQHWKDMGWDIDYIIDQSLKWHISTFNAKSSPIPREWEPNINRWQKKMGYRLALRKFTHPDVVKPAGKFTFTSWWENLGVAPCYKTFPLALRLKNDHVSETFTTSVDIRQWLPGDSLYDHFISIPANMPLGHYQLEIAILNPHTQQPGIQLAIEGRQPNGWYALGNVEVQQQLESPPSPHEGVLGSPW